MRSTVNFVFPWAALKALVLVLTVSAVTHARATEVPMGPGEVVTQATDRILAIVQEAKGYFDADPDRYFTAIGMELDAVVDFRGFARGVMGDYASGARYRTLDEAGRERLKAQLNDFTAVLRDNVIRTYSRGLLAFGGSQIEVGETEFSPDNNKVASVISYVSGEGDKPYVLKYQMGQYRDGSWKLRNLIIENINLGEIYRGQFAASAADLEGDLDQVIAQWDQTQSEDEAEGDSDASE